MERGEKVKWATVMALCAVVAAACMPSRVAPGDPPAVYLGTQLDGAAPDFRLSDENGRTTSLSDYRGQVVVLAFMDSRCREVCPRTSAELLTTHRALGPDAASVTFLGVNVNAEASGVADAASATAEWQLGEIPSWRFLTASPEELRPVWEAYGIGVVPSSSEDGELLHSTGAYLIDRSGDLRWYLSTSLDEPSSLSGLPSLSELLLTHLEELLTEG